MHSPTLYRVAADAILLLHVAFVAFVVVGLVLILVGGVRDWRWVRNPWFRALHIAAIAFVVLQAWLGRICPLTTWEMALRQQAGDAVYRGAFIAHWLEQLLYYDAPAWVFTLLYTAFGAAVAASWYFVRPEKLRYFRRRR